MRLQSLIPTIPRDLVAALEACGIRTDTEFLFSGTPIDILQRLPSGVISLADLKTCIALVTESASVRGIPGDVLYAGELQTQREDLSCGVDELDTLVNGFGNGRVFEVSGDKGSGKTSLVLQIALRLLAGNRGTSVLWMDTTGDFSAERTRQVAQHLYGEVGGSSTVLERLQVSLVLNVEAAFVLLEELESSLTTCTLDCLTMQLTQGRQTNASRRSRVRLVIIDTITPLLASSLSAVSSHGHAVMTDFMRHLRSMARSYHLTFLVSVNAFYPTLFNSSEIVNNTSASHIHNNNSLPVFSSTTRKPALGPSFTFLTDCTIWLAKYKDTASGESMHLAEILKSRSTRSGTWCEFKIQNGVLRSITQG